MNARLLVALAWIAALPASAQDFDACLKDLRGEATANGIATQTLDLAFAGLQADPTVFESMENQPEFETPVWEYLAKLVDDRRIAEGRAMLEQWRRALTVAQRRYGVDRNFLVAVWGVETDYGRIMGRRSLVRSLATLSCGGPRQRYFRGELMATLQILQSGDVRPELLRGSWAGAFGHSQFMPSTFKRAAVDLDGDGRRDIVGSIPDALGSIGNYLKEAGWVTGQPWGYEVKLPAGYNGPSGRHNKQDLAEWKRLGIQRADRKPLLGPDRAALLLPAGTRGPAFLVFQNFNAIHAYNNSESYALAIAHLSDRMQGGGPILAKWPTDDRLLSRAERVELQLWLIERGFYSGAADGILGSRTVEAIKAFQSATGISADGFASARVLRALREAPT
ncbi:MAG TPA: lytic murein transglycosylase [Usitatibacter sp.]|nr:lytic murein transglycosylase [Usitatibacter sp.]